MNKKTWIGIIVVVIIIIIAFSSSSTKQNSDNFKIGVILPLSGPAGVLGEASKKAVELAVSNLSDIEKSKIEIIYGDDQLDPKQTVSVAQKLIDVDHVNALVAYSSPSSVAASFVAEKNKVPMIGLGNTPDVNTGKQWVIRLMLGPEAQARAIENFLLKGKYKKIALMWNQSDGPKSVHDELVKILPQDGYTIVIDESVTKAEKDFKTSITKIKASKPEVVLAYISPQIGIFARQAKELALNIPLVSGPTFELVDQIQAAQGGLDNQLFVGSDNTKFVDEYHAKYNSYPTIAGDYLYDSVTRLARIANQKDISNTAIINFLRKDFSGVAGNYSYNGDGSFDVRQVVKKWDGQKFVVVQ